MQYKRITMPRELKRILTQLGKEKKPMFCKGKKDLYFGFRPIEYRENAGILGQIQLYNHQPKRFEKVVVNFSVGTHRFFAQGKFGSDEKIGLLKIDPVFYRLERREHLRIPLLPSVTKVCNIIQWIKKVVFIQADILDLSLGGVHLAVPAEQFLPVRQGSVLRLVLHVKSKWSIDVLAEVRRVELGPKKVLLGMKFKDKDSRTQRQIQALSMELQREFIRNDSFVES